MRDAIDDVLVGGAAARARLLPAVGRSGLDDEIRQGHLARLFPRAYCRPWDVDQIETMEAAAIASIGSPVALSHLSALRRVGLGPAPPEVHVSVPAARVPRSRPGLRIHRVDRPPRQRLIAGLPTVGPAVAIVTSWPLLSPGDRRTPAITAVREGLVGPGDLRRELDQRPRLAGRQKLGTLIDLLEGGCESELEIWGCLSVFDAPGLRHGSRQTVVRVRGRAYRIDLAYEAERVAVEMDGESFHSTPEQRERDRIRDAALAAIGWLTLRFSWARLHYDLEGCRRDTLAALATRRR